MFLHKFHRFFSIQKFTMTIMGSVIMAVMMLARQCSDVTLMQT